MLKFALIPAALIGLAALACAQSELSGADQFPQFRGMSGLPGGGFAVDQDGNPGSVGAMSLSTPIGYALGHRRFNLGVSVVSNNGTLKFFRNEHDASAGNGTASLMYGLDFGKAGRGTIGVMVLSSQGDHVYNLQYQPGGQSGPVRYSVGVQDFFGRGGSAGETIVGDSVLSRSFFGVATAKVLDDTYISVGIGTRRFEKGFINASTNIGRDFKATIEHDGFNMNVGLACTLGYDRDDRGRNVTMFLGFVRNKYLTWAVNVSY